MENYDEYTSKGIVFRYNGFEKITNHEDAYFIGYMSSDGSYIAGKKGDKFYPRMGLTSTDAYIVKAFQQRYSPDTAINNREPRSGNFKANKSTLEISFPRVLSKTFNHFGIFCFKPERRVIGIPKQFMSSYVLGVIDADGSIVVRHRKDCRTPRLNIHIVSGALNLLTDIQRYLDIELGISSSVYVRDTKCSDLRINHTGKAIAFCNWIYSSRPETYNFRKYGVFQNYLKSISDSSSANEDELLET